MVIEDLVGYSFKSFLRSDFGVGGFSDRDYFDFVKMLFYVVKNIILEELWLINVMMVKWYILKYCIVILNFDIKVIYYMNLMSNSKLLWEIYYFNERLLVLKWVKCYLWSVYS